MPKQTCTQAAQAQFVFIISFFSLLVTALLIVGLRVSWSHLERAVETRCRVIQGSANKVRCRFKAQDLYAHPGFYLSLGCASSVVVATQVAYLIWSRSCKIEDNEEVISARAFLSSVQEKALGFDNNGGERDPLAPQTEAPLETWTFKNVKLTRSSATNRIDFIHGKSRWSLQVDGRDLIRDTSDVEVLYSPFSVRNGERGIAVEVEDDGKSILVALEEEDDGDVKTFRIENALVRKGKEKLNWSSENGMFNHTIHID